MNSQRICAESEEEEKEKEENTARQANEKEDLKHTSDQTSNTVHEKLGRQQRNRPT